jgi:predicted RNA binding protein YcfA (HicA-like mRNA interferase family)
MQMSRKTKQLNKLLNVASDGTWTQEELAQMLSWYGFEKREGKGSHSVYVRPGKPGAITLAAHGSRVKTGYVRTVREHIQAILEENKQP